MPTLANLVCFPSSSEVVSCVSSHCLFLLLCVVYLFFVSVL
jgi:hypothetical protein